MHGEELKYMTEAFESNWVSTVGANIDAVEAGISDYLGISHAVGLSSGTAALHMAIRYAARKLYKDPGDGGVSLTGKKVFCSDMTFDATVNPVLYEGGTPVFIDTEEDTWNMSPEALKRAFDEYPDVKLVVFAHLYGVPAKTEEIMNICHEHGALVVEDAAESLGATYRGAQTGSFGDYNCISFNGNKIITGSSGGMFLTDDEEAAAKIRKWSTQSRDDAPWYQHSELGYNYRMSNVIAGVIRGQLLHLDEHIAQKKKIYERYKKALSDLPARMNPYDEKDSVPNYWLSCMLIDSEAMCPQNRTDNSVTYTSLAGHSCPSEILDAISDLNAEGRPIWKPMHMQPIYSRNPFVTADAVYPKGISGIEDESCGADIFERGLCLPSDNKMTPEVQDVIIEAIHECF